jgi:hypothetical protein
VFFQKITFTLALPGISLIVPALSRKRQATESSLESSRRQPHVNNFQSALVFLK